MATTGASVRSSPAVVDGFDLYQANDDTIYLAITYHTKDEARLTAAKPFLPADVDFTDNTTILPYYRSLRLDDMKVKDLLLVRSMQQSTFSC